MKTFLALALALYCSVTYAKSDSNLVIIGGGLEQTNANVYQSLIDLAGGQLKANIAIFGANSGYPDESIAYNRETFESFYGVKTTGMPIDAESMDSLETAIESLKKKHSLETQQEVIDFLERTSKLPPELKIIEKLKKTTGIYFGGGDQSRSKKLLFREDGSETYLLSFLRHQMRKGHVFSGTSAGAAMQSHPMITGGYSLGSLRRSQYEVSFEKGFGFLNEVVVDQHFGQRGRLARLVAAMHRSNTPLGVGIDEDTALVVQKGKWKVRGSGHVYLVQLNPNGHIQEASLTVLSEGDAYEPKAHKLTPGMGKFLTQEDLSLRKGKQTHEGEVFESLEIERAIRKLQQGNAKRVEAYTTSKQQGIGMGFSLNRKTKLYLSEGANGHKLTIQNLKIHLLNVPHLKEKFPPRRTTCFEMASKLLISR